ncbi:MAG: hypothetical protein J5956_00890 [Ruminococcus sp.]|nr:hypothetical protein [Ruminococcus sp.]
MSKSQIIVTSRYIKSGTKKSKTKRANLTKYIATRESVEKRPQNKESVTKSQTQLINDLLTEFPKAKQFLEYEDYSAKPTAENASELISTIIERYADVIGNRKNFVGYMAMRPGAEKRGPHGLFNDKDEPINLNGVANEVANHPGNVWTHVVSLRREDAVRLGYTNSEIWRQLVKRHIADIAQAQNIPLANLKWYAAFHDTSHHPHIHLIVYSTNPKQGYLTNQGIEKIRSVFANDIFHDGLKNIYQQQTLTRDELKALAEDQMKDISDEFKLGDLDDPLLHSLIIKLKKQLDESSGKKVYGYLKKPVKQTVDEIFLELSKNEHIKDLYDKWCEFEKAKYRYYTSKDVEPPKLVDNKAFKPVKNMIIKTVMNMELPDTEIDIQKDEGQEDVSQSEQMDEDETSELELPTLPADRDSFREEQKSDEQHRQKEQEALTATVMSLFVNLCSIIRNDYAQEQKKLRPKADRKLQRMIRKKEISLGLKYDDMDMKM